MFTNIKRKHILNFNLHRPLGSLNYLRIRHDNSGKGSYASWFLKYIVVRNLQTMETNYFICQQWLGVEKDSGLVDNKDIYLKYLIVIFTF
jgi:polycystin 1L2